MPWSQDTTNWPCKSSLIAQHIHVFISWLSPKHIFTNGIS
jgi:hypothetical protein